MLEDNNHRALVFFRQGWRWRLGEHGDDVTTLTDSGGPFATRDECITDLTLNYLLEPFQVAVEDREESVQ